MAAKSIFKPAGMTREEERAYVQIQLAADPEGAATRHAELVAARQAADEARVTADARIVEADEHVAQVEQHLEDMRAHANAETKLIHERAGADAERIVSTARAEAARLTSEAQAASKTAVDLALQQQIEFDAARAAIGDERIMLDRRYRDLELRESAVKAEKAALAKRAADLAAAIKAAS